MYDFVVIIMLTEGYQDLAATGGWCQNKCGLSDLLKFNDWVIFHNGIHVNGGSFNY